mmetsp:Transcript_12214/g.12637  ORF Transcript_12214/g.12637 Transcript_12214/m.12637 type:complete len:445 (-) Transcript_12214:41-1375(-)
MVQLQITKGYQVFLLSRDKLLKSEENDKLKILSLKLQEDLGSIRYIFTDKTGTLTKNEMEFKACSIFTYLYDQKKEANEIQEQEEIDNENEKRKHVEFKRNSNQEDQSQNSAQKIKEKSVFSKEFNTECLVAALFDYSKVNTVDLEDSPYETVADVTRDFFVSIACNHNVLSEVDEKTGWKNYQGASPDECVLVKSAEELGVEFIDREGSKINLNIFDDQVEIETLHRFEYSSSRMRSSAIVRDCKGEIKLYIKGADSVLLKRLDVYSKNYLLQKTKEDLDMFAKNGLRTLVYGVKRLSEEQLKEWEVRYQDLKFKAIQDKSLNNAVEELISEIENGITLLGVTALEDKLQDEVTSCLNSFIESGISVFMLTGDKLDTAETIGYSCKLFKEDTEVFKVKAETNPEDMKAKLTEILEEMNKMEKELNNMKMSKNKDKKQKKNWLP